MVLYDSSKTAQLMNVTLKNLAGTTTTTDGASADGLTVAEDLSNFVQCGQAMYNALTNTPSLFYNAVTTMLETVAEIYFEIMSSEGYNLNAYDLKVSRGEFACLREKVRINPEDFEAAFVLDGESGSSHSSTFADLFQKHPFTFNVKVWGNKGIYRTKPFTISYEIFKTSVQSVAGYERLIAAMWATIDAVMEIAVSESPYFLIRQQIANAALYRSGVRVVNLCAAYKAETGNDFAAIDDPSFASWFVRRQRYDRMLMRKATNKFSGNSTLKMNTPERLEKKFLIQKFYDLINTGLAGIYHDDKIGNIDDYNLEPYIQNINEPQTLDVVPANPPVITSGKHVTKVTFAGTIVGMIWDKRGTFWATEYERVAANRNDFDDHVNYISTVAASHCVDEDSNVIVYVLDSTKTGANYNKGYTITEETDEE